MTAGAHVTVDAVVTLGLVVLLPLGLRLIHGLPDLRWWPMAGVVGATAVWLPRGPWAVACAAVYATATLLLAFLGARRAWGWVVDAGNGRSTTGPQELAALTALATPAVGAAALVAERAGSRLFGFDLDVLALTVPHLHFAGFAAALVAGLVSRAVARDVHARRWGDVAAATVPVGTLLVVVGYFIGDAAELVGAAVLTAGMWLVAWLTWTRVRSAFAVGGVRGRRTIRLLLSISALVLAGTMTLALSWAVGQVTGWPHPSLSWMVATHGVANAVGFALCAVVAWRLIGDEAL